MEEVKEEKEGNSYREFRRHQSRYYHLLFRYKSLRSTVNSEASIFPTFKDTYSKFSLIKKPVSPTVSLRLPQLFDSHLTGINCRDTVLTLMTTLSQ